MLAEAHRWPDFWKFADPEVRNGMTARAKWNFMGTQLRLQQFLTQGVGCAARWLRTPAPTVSFGTLGMFFHRTLLFRKSLCGEVSIVQSVGKLFFLGSNLLLPPPFDVGRCHIFLWAFQ
jgi:hypothetical protein